MIDTAKLQLIEEYSGLFLNHEEIAILIAVDLEDFLREMRNKKSEAYKAYFKGRTLSKVEVRKKVIELAKKGSQQAEELTRQYIKDQEVQNG